MMRPQSNDPGPGSGVVREMSATTFAERHHTARRPTEGAGGAAAAR